MNFIKSLRLVLLGVAMAAATLSSVEPASALGGCGANAIAMRGADAYGVVKTKTGACERRVIAPLTWAVELALLQVMSELAQPLQISPRLCAGLFFAP